MRIWKLLFKRNRVFKHRSLFPFACLIVMDSGKNWLHKYFTFLQEFLPPHIRNNLIFFRIICYVMTNIHFSDFDNKNLPNPYVLKFPSKLLLEKRMFTLTYVDFVYETSISIWEFELMIVTK